MPPLIANLSLISGRSRFGDPALKSYSSELLKVRKFFFLRTRPFSDSLPLERKSSPFSANDLPSLSRQLMNSGWLCGNQAVAKATMQTVDGRGLTSLDRGVVWALSYPLPPIISVLVLSSLRSLLSFVALLVLFFGPYTLNYVPEAREKKNVNYYIKKHKV